MAQKRKNLSSGDRHWGSVIFFVGSFGPLGHQSCPQWPLIEFSRWILVDSRQSFRETLAWLSFKGQGHFSGWFKKKDGILEVTKLKETFPTETFFQKTTIILLSMIDCLLKVKVISVADLKRKKGFYKSWTCSWFLCSWHIDDNVVITSKIMIYRPLPFAQSISRLVNIDMLM